jgi:hypothetical protein
MMMKYVEAIVCFILGTALFIGASFAARHAEINSQRRFWLTTIFGLLASVLTVLGFLVGGAP